MEPIIRPQAIIDYCLAPLDLNPMHAATEETRRRLEHVIKTFQMRVPQPVAVDFSAMPTLVINEAAHGYE
ncbi:hypothetical protein [Asticcacaulis sp. AC402]|uniref:hypothetical protein n=1 Tax=Asticcacaulis sp. AC402 TaxID=1282361 RepID=UPI0003C401C1|nr:hypothetical protein [Asticcacaulis sp. AC402]ESQ75707.1 hypothetical protein ABAC402_07015 [Asticcacaulis sp. AC402]